MRIAHVSATFPPYHGGTGNVCFHNARELACYGHDVHVFTARAGEAAVTEEREGFHIHRLQPLLRYGNAFFLPSLFSHLRNFDLVHLHLPFYGGAEAVYLWHKYTKRPLVVTYHQDVELRGWADLFSRWHDRLLGAALLRNADRTCFTSLDYGRASRYAALIEQRKLNVVELPNGVDTARFTPGLPPAHLVERYDVKKRPVLLFVGALDRAHYFKGVDVLLEAIALLGREEAICIIAGQGDLLDEYRQQAQELGLDEQVYFAGFVPDAELVDYYRLANVTVLPSTTAGEAFGLVLLESFACGTPVIASALPGVRTVVLPQVDGLWVQPGSVTDLVAGLEKMLTLPAARRQEMGLAGRRKTETRYSWQRIGLQLETMYAEIEAEHRQTSEKKRRRKATK